jgi:methylthioribulose-1-phosphate dehydratase
LATTFDQYATRSALVEIARDFHARGWMAGTAGNLSAKPAHDNDSFWMTAGGRPKGRLDENDFIRVRVSDGTVLERKDSHVRPSGELSIHQTVYTLFPAMRACLHVHTVDACLAASRAHATPGLRLPALEMLKGLGVYEYEPRVQLPLFDNLLDAAELAQSIRARFAAEQPEVPALMVRDHGVTVWGASLQEAYNRVEIMEFIMSYLARRG